MKKLIRRLILILIVFGLCFLGYYIYAVSPKAYEFSEQKYVSSNISSQLNGFKIAFISDVNITNQESLTRFQSVIQELNNYPFDMVIFGGDLYDDQVYKADEVAKALKSIHCQYGKLAVLGERDENYSLEVTQILNNGGFEVMNNESRPIYYKDTSFTLVTYNDEYDFSQLKTSQDKFILGISHEPDTFSQAKNYVNLQISGHSYGGSIYLPYLGAMFPVEGAKTYNHGTYQEKNATLIVSNGLSGPSSFPFKVLCPNQVPFILLTSKSNDTSQ